MIDVEDSLRELRLLTKCTCRPPYPLASGRQDPSCLEDWRSDVEVLAAELSRTRAVVEAATALVEEWYPNTLIETALDSNERMYEALDAAVAALSGVPAPTKTTSVRRLARIAEAHSKDVGLHGMTSGLCVECAHPWPCPTHTWATGDRDAALDPWNPLDDAAEGQPDTAARSVPADREECGHSVHVRSNSGRRGIPVVAPGEPEPDFTEPCPVPADRAAGETR